MESEYIESTLRRLVSVVTLQMLTWIMNKNLNIQISMSVKTKTQIKWTNKIATFINYYFIYCNIRKQKDDEAHRS